jgi:hypothetical protein
MLAEAAKLKGAGMLLLAGTLHAAAALSYT